MPMNGLPRYKWKNIPFIGLHSDGYSSARLFLPAAGDRWNESLNNVGSNGYYWSRTLNSNNPYNSYNLNFNSGNWGNWNNNNRNNGHTVRAVRVS